MIAAGAAEFREARIAREQVDGRPEDLAKPR